MHPEIIRLLAEDRRREITAQFRPHRKGQYWNAVKRFLRMCVEAGADSYDTDAAPLPELENTP